MRLTKIQFYTITGLLAKRRVDVFGSSGATSSKVPLNVARNLHAPHLDQLQVHTCFIAVETPSHHRPI